MKIGIAATPSVWSAGAYPRSLVGIQERAPQVEQRAQDEVGEKHGDALAVVALRVQELAQDVGRDPHDDHERGE
jgi:hypothetical protein